MDDKENHVTTHFAQNLSSIKILLKDWEKYKKDKDDQAIIHIEAGLPEIHNSEGGDFISHTDKEKLISLDSNRTKILKERNKIGG